MTSKIYGNVYLGVGLVTSLALTTLNPAEAGTTLAGIVQSNDVKNPGIYLAQQKHQTNLESFLTAEYRIGQQMPAFLKDSVVPQDEIHHYHSLRALIIKEGKSDFIEKIYLESALVYIKARSLDGRELHIIYDFKPDFELQYVVTLYGGEGTAIVIDEKRRFNKEHFIKKIRDHLQKQPPHQDSH